ncbi:SDR family NAD(P)-dependent oxidoreductase [Sulfuracidifex metallicus]|uniref:SDR family oxidoreductase n=1 Tax=Sulfuracidifex metallicus DSM 6482 = JCM 9184 TaxID=523847 RepID=A0A6A9QMB1_SULME|nr:SDR family NAD(P)-dependent oxidoreductase [Sulfuracidifex metallicus]MUN29450.1 SDR family oxidoreductase [Sulfuracidifex metallicus DSM 6482 = JCM 9184]WOE50038.1 SDR family NAD(P)-dependent oxidoreductase [Sulfuracidifex metallicus DSM 6482 = JCM 9184]
MGELLLERRVGVIGVSEGLGYALAYFLLKDGAHVIINSRNASKLEKIKNTLAKYGKIETFVGSMDNEKEIEDFFQECKKSLGGIDDLVITIGGYVEDNIYDPKGLDLMINSQIKTPIKIISSGVKFLHEGSTIMMVSAMRGIRNALPNQLSYGIAKAGVAKAVEVIASSLLDKGIRVIGIAPSVIDGNFQVGRNWKSMRKLGDWKAPPEDFASVMSLLLSERASWINGVVIPVDGGAFLK